MPNSCDRAAIHWLDVVAELLSRPLTSWPSEELSAQLLETFDCSFVTWNQRDSDGRAEFHHRGHLDVDVGTVRDLVDHELDRHPLVRWYMTVPNSPPQTMHRVPEIIAPRRDRLAVEDVMRPLSAEHQLGLPIHLEGMENRSFGVMRGESDFTDQELALAERLTRVLVALDRQIGICRSAAASPDPAAARHVGLTGRELAVLTLLAEGMTAARIGHRLGISERTVQKHLEHLYRKLDVPDRLSAVRLSEALGMVKPLVDVTSR
jgi:DNA-binding CsgD family transcriptional regulator